MLLLPSSSPSPPQIHLHNKVLWRNALPAKVKRCASLLLSLNLLTWHDLLEDGNLFWEIALNDKDIWPEPERWYATLCNFLLLLAWEKNIEGVESLFPSARLQIVNE